MGWIAENMKLQMICRSHKNLALYLIAVNKYDISNSMIKLLELIVAINLWLDNTFNWVWWVITSHMVSHRHKPRTQHNILIESTNPRKIKLGWSNLTLSSISDFDNISTCPWPPSYYYKVNQWELQLRNFYSWGFTYICYARKEDLVISDFPRCKVARHCAEI